MVDMTTAGIGAAMFGLLWAIVVAAWALEGDAEERERYGQFVMPVLGAVTLGAIAIVGAVTALSRGRWDPYADSVYRDRCRECGR